MKAAEWTPSDTLIIFGVIKTERERHKGRRCERHYKSKGHKRGGPNELRETNWLKRGIAGETQREWLIHGRRCEWHSENVTDTREVVWLKLKRSDLNKTSSVRVIESREAAWMNLGRITNTKESVSKTQREWLTQGEAVWMNLGRFTNTKDRVSKTQSEWLTQREAEWMNLGRVTDTKETGYVKLKENDWHKGRRCEWTWGDLLTQRDSVSYFQREWLTQGQAV